MCMQFCIYVVHSTTEFFSVEEMQIDAGCSSQQLFVQKLLFFNSDVCGNTFFFPVLEIFLVWLGSGRIGMCLEQTLEWEWSGGPILLPWKPMLKDHIMLSFSQQTWMKSKIWSQKITTSIKWIQVFWDKYSMGLFPNKIINGTEKMGLPSIW